MTIAQALTGGIAALAESSASPRSDALLLLSHVLERDRAWIAAHGEALLSESRSNRFRALCELRGKGKPIAYILGFAGFYGREFVVNEHVLVPRPETEHLIDEAIAFVKSHAAPDAPKRAFTVLDVGTGSGAIACTIAAELPGVFVEGSDTSTAALEVAERNARRLDVRSRCRFHHGNLAEPVGDRRFDVAIANLPYIPTAELPRPPDPVSFEPREALDGGPDGLEVYRKLLRAAPSIVEPTGLLLLEAASPAIHDLAELVARAFPGATVELGNDYAGLPRYVKAQGSAIATVPGYRELRS